MPERSLLDILATVNCWTEWVRHFGPLFGSEPKLADPSQRYILTAFTFGCNLGPPQAARHLQGLATAHELSFTNRRHVSVDQLDAAIKDLINAYHRCDLPKVWGSGSSAAADGTKYDLLEKGLLAECTIRYGGYGGIAYQHVADTFVALFSHLIQRHPSTKASADVRRVKPRQYCPVKIHKRRPQWTARRLVPWAPTRSE